jgi:predicted N-acetyltransferase YhbS
MKWLIRTETEKDFAATEEVVRQAFVGVEHSDGSEPALVARLRKSTAFVPELSLVAECKGVLVGHILFTKLEVVSDDKQVHDSLALAPVSVLPSCQRMGVGSALIEEGHKRAASLGFRSVILLGHPDYYPRFGYEKASKWKIKAPFDVPDESFMARELVESGLSAASGVVKYPPAFGL